MHTYQQTDAIEWNARRISVMKYLGELYNYRMCESALIFETLYTVLFFSHDLTVEGLWWGVGRISLLFSRALFRGLRVLCAHTALVRDLSCTAACGRVR